MTEPVDETQGRNRWLLLSLSRLAATVLVVLGILIIGDSLALPEVLGWVLLAVGLAGTFILPQVLARKWRTPRG